MFHRIATAFNQGVINVHYVMRRISNLGMFNIFKIYWLGNLH
jgi:hypothetical protein